MSGIQTNIEKIKVWVRFLKKDFNRNGVLVSCGFCNSSNIKFEFQHEEKRKDHVYYRSLYECKDCGATCGNEQYWYNTTIMKGKKTNE